jgi:predicted nuclease of predicted toxin-antitoxin system
VTVRLLADESCDFSAVRALRAAGFDVCAIVERFPGATDDEVIALSVSEERVLLTEDKDFGQLVFAANRESVGVILIRFPAPARSSLAARVVQVVQRESEGLRGAFVVIQPRRTRVSRLPT